MKKIFLTVALVAAMLCAGNTANAQFRVNAGYTTNSFIEYSSTTDLSVTRGFFLGAENGRLLWNGLGIAGGLQCRYHWYSEDMVVSGTPTKVKEQSAGLDVPIYFNYRIEFTDDFYIAPLLGVSFSYAFIGKTTTDPDVGSFEWYKNGPTDLYLNRVSIGLLMGLDISYSKLHLFWRINYVPMVGDLGGERVTSGQNLLGLGYEF